MVPCIGTMTLPEPLPRTPGVVLAARFGRGADGLGAVRRPELGHPQRDGDPPTVDLGGDVLAHLAVAHRHGAVGPRGIAREVEVALDPVRRVRALDELARR